MVTLDDGREIVARIARRYMPRLKTESEVIHKHIIFALVDSSINETQISFVTGCHNKLCAAEYQYSRPDDLSLRLKSL